MLDGARILELAHKAHFLYLKQTPEEQAKLLKIVVSNCSIDAANVYPTYRKPFDLIFAQGKNEGWRARRDSNSRPLVRGEMNTSLPRPRRLLNSHLSLAASGRTSAAQPVDEGGPDAALILYSEHF